MLSYRRELILLQVSMVNPNILKIQFNYNESLVKRIQKIPKARFVRDALQAYWIIPVSSVPYALQNSILNEGHFFPAAMNLVDKNTYKNIAVEVKADRIKLTGNMYLLTRLKAAVEALCSYDNKIDDQYVIETLAETIYQSKNVVVIKFPKGLQQRVVDYLKAYNLKSFLIHPEQVNLTALEGLNVAHIQPRPYQEAAYNKIKSGAIPNRATLTMATGAGKTLLAGFITATLAVPTVFYVYSTDLLNQTAAVFEEMFQTEIGRVGGNRFTIKPITVASLQTVYSCFEKQDERWSKLKQYLDTVNLMFVDEGHMLGAETIYKVAELTDAYYSYSLTATPYREDGKELFIEAATGPTVELVAEEELVKGGYVLPVEIEVVPVKHYMPRKRNYRKLYEAEIIDNWDRHRAVINSVQRHRGKQIIILVKDIRHGKKIQDNLNCPFIHGKSSAMERINILDRFRNQEINLLIASSILRQGIDLPEAEVLILAHGGVSTVELLQKIGRVRRPAPNKTKGIVVDFYDCIQPEVSDDVFRKQSEKRMALYGSKGFTVTKLSQKLILV